jgi:hypothetical protein
VAFIWYPGALLLAGGAEEGLKIVIGVDIILGPLLTLVIYNINKSRKELVRDLSIIAVFQLACLTIGMILVHEQRPLAVVYSENNFYILDKKQLEKENIELSSLDRIKGNYPKIIIEKPPEDLRALTQYSIAKSSLFSTKFYSELWVDFPKDKATIENYIAIDESSSCAEITLINYDQSGTACFNFKQQSFSNYK